MGYFSLLLCEQNVFLTAGLCVLQSNCVSCLFNKAVNIKWVLLQAF